MGYNKIKQWIRRFLTCVFILSFIPIQLTNQNITYCRFGNIFESSFQEPFEIIYVLFPDGQIYGFYTGETYRTVLPCYSLKQDYNRDIKDACIVMHNHPALCRLSDADKKLARYLYSLGYRGSFGIYVTSVKKVFIWIYDDRGRLIPYGQEQ